MAASVKIIDHNNEGSRVTLKVQVLGDDGRYIENLNNKREFKIQTTNGQKPVDPSTIEFILVPPERQSNPDPVYATILLDMSGSMRHHDWGQIKTQKLKGAIQAIEKFIEAARQENIPIKISLVPFGYRGKSNCDSLYEVSEESIEKDSPFFEVTNNTLTSKLKELSSVPVCASTNLYKPLLAAKSHLNKQLEQVPINLSQENKPQPRLAVILLSDGYDRTSEAQFRELTSLLQQAQVTVNTLSYGESLSHLRDRAVCTRFIPDDQLTPDKVSHFCSLPNQDINEFIIDEGKLERLARETGGHYYPSSDVGEVTKNLINVLTSWRYYQLVYRQPGADRGSLHYTSVEVNSQTRNINATSNEVDIRLCERGCYPPSWQERLLIFIFIALLSSIGIFSFRKWSKKLKADAEKGVWETS